MMKVCEGKGLTKDEALFLFDNCSFVIFKDFPEGIEIGIDYISYTTGPKFMGLKMIPPGVHYICVSYKGAPRIGFFHCFKDKEIMMKKWNKEKETYDDIKLSIDEENVIRSNIRNLDKNLGSYPFENMKNWISLSSFITKDVVDKLNPSCGRITSQQSFITEEERINQINKTSNIVDKNNPTRLRFSDQIGLPIFNIKEDEVINFTEIPKITIDIVNKRAGTDNSCLLEELLKNYKNNEKLLGEFQYSFVVFLIGQAYEGFEQWKRFLHLFSTVKSILSSQVTLFDKIFMILYYQISTCPEEFFNEVIENNNFIRCTLSLLFINIEDSNNLPEAFKKKVCKIKCLFEKKFNCSFDLSNE
uniref:Protein AAR2 homolog n=1 Tax=Parastrongyloides trichosuri TaxID=131310 RepID=A0A0N4ZKR9_PARTI